MGGARLARTGLAPVLAACAALAAGPRRAGAHADLSPLAIAVDLDRGRVAVILRWLVPGGDAAREMRERFDRDADGALDTVERAALAEWLVRRAREAFAMAVDGRALAFEATVMTLDLPDGASARVGVTVRLVAKVRWRKGEARVTIAAETREATPVGVRAGKRSGLALPEGWRGGEASRGAPFVFGVRTR